MSFFEVATFKIDPNALHLGSAPLLVDPPYDQPTAALRCEVSRALRLLKTGSKHPFHLLQDVQDPTLIYFVGKWNSMEEHNEFAKSDARNDLLAVLDNCKAHKQGLDLYELVHPQHGFAVPLPFSFHSTGATLKADVVCITRCRVSQEYAASFGKKFGEVKGPVERASGYKAIAGLKAPLEGDGHVLRPHSTSPGEETELVVLNGWASVEQYRAFPIDAEDKSHFQSTAEGRSVERRVTKLVDLE